MAGQRPALDADHGTRADTGYRSRGQRTVRRCGPTSRSIDARWGRSLATGRARASRRCPLHCQRHHCSGGRGPSDRCARGGSLDGGRPAGGDRAWARRAGPGGRPVGPRPARIERADGAGTVRKVADVSSASVDAYRAFTAGVEARSNERNADARRLFEEAVRVDPEFALAYVHLAEVNRHENHDQRESTDG